MIDREKGKRLTNQSIATPSSPEKEDPLRYGFVEMLFALAISQVAIHAADLTSIADSEAFPAAAWAHLALSLVVIGASWIGWRQSQSPGMKAQIETLFSRRAFALFLDVLLVILYFILVRSVELRQQDGSTTLTAPSATDDAKWICAIFAVYVVWDLFADVFSPGCLTEHGRARLLQGIKVAAAASSASLLCMLLAWVLLSVAQGIERSLQVVLLDASLLCLVLFFRVAKVFEHPLATRLGVESCKAFLAPRRDSPHARALAASLMVVGIVSALGAALVSG